MKTANELKDLIAEKREAILALKAKADTEKRDAFTAEEKTAFNKLVEERKVLEADLETAQELESQVAARSLTKAPSVVLDAPSAKQDKDLKKYSFLRAINLKAENRSLDGIELEMHQEAEKEVRGFGETIKGFGIPSFLMEARAGHNATGAATEGKQTIETVLRTENFIDVLFSNTWADKVGVTKLSGLQGNIDIPRQNNKPTVATVTETGVAADTQLSFDKVTLTPGRIAAKAPLTKQLMIQSSLGVEAYILKLLGKQFTEKINTDALSTLLTAVTENPFTGVTTTNGLTFTYDALLEMERTLASADIGNADSWKWLTNPNVRKKAKGTAQLGNTINAAIWGANNEMAGYQSVVTNLVASNGTKGSGTGLSTAVLGDFSELIVAQWGGMDTIIDPYTLGDAGQIRILCDMFMGYAVTRAASFTKTTQIITT